LWETFGEYIKGVVGRMFPTEGAASFECAAYVGLSGDALWYGSLADKSMISSVSFIKVLQSGCSEWQQTLAS